MNSPRTICFDGGWRTIEEIGAIAEKNAAASLSPAPEFRAAIARGADFLDRRLAEQGAIYGVTTGFGDSCTVAIAPDLIAELPRGAIIKKSGNRKKVAYPFEMIKTKGCLFEQAEKGYADERETYWGKRIKGKLLRRA